jgi:hypothetical protein
MNAARLGSIGLCVGALTLTSCADDGGTTVTQTVPGTTATPSTTTDTEARTTTEATVTEAGGGSAALGNHGPHYFQTPSQNIGCFISAHDARCDSRERSWSPPPEPASCKKIGLAYGQGIVVGPNHAEFICAGDTALGGEATLGYGQTARRGALRCHSGQKGITCSNADNGHGFFLSKESYRIF